MSRTISVLAFPNLVLKNLQHRTLFRFGRLACGIWRQKRASDRGDHRQHMYPLCLGYRHHHTHNEKEAIKK
ncbi:hypothetical protein CEXT_131071 [Caerostris extrusa]|uniref:Uncharacterized protein n=1 Tax=Caerostris extrusa TaxID=172846 RepID=A0AAV4SC66_CAEEX|nr:hypothetical protein CEXT_131071 [Caerostris extrusa]